MADQIENTTLLPVSHSVKLLDKINSGSFWVNRSLAFLGGIYAFGVMWTTIIDVFGRYFLGKPLPAANEIGELMVVYAAFLGLGLVQLRREHASVTMLVDRVSPGFQISTRLLVFLVSAIFFAIFGWQSFKEAMHSTGIMATYISYPIPIYPAKWAVFTGFSLLSLQLFFDAAAEVINLIRIGARRK